MGTKIALFLLLFQTSWVLRASAGPRQPEDLDAKLRVIVHNHQLQASNFVEALTRAASQFQVPIGIEWVNTSRAKARVTLSWKDATVREIFDAIVKTQPDYEMQAKNGVVHVYSAKLIPDRQNFLRLSVNQFEVDREVVEMASWKLRERVRLTVSPPSPQPGPGGVGGSFITNMGEPKISLKLNNVSVEDALDALAVASTRKIWIVTFSDDTTLTPTAFRRTLTVWNKSPIPDNEQPVWDMLRWGDAIPADALVKNGNARDSVEIGHWERSCQFCLN